MTDEAFTLIDAGATIETILARMEAIRQDMNLFLSPATLKYAQMSGRVSALGSAVASLLNIKPIIVLQDGELLASERVRTRRRAFTRMVEMMQERLGDRPARVGVAHARAADDAAVLAGLAAEALVCDEVLIAPLATSVAVHLGPGTVGLIAYAI